MDTKRHMFEYLLDDIETLPVSRLQEPLQEIASGTSSFGASDEWATWYHYLLAALIPRSHESHVDYLLEHLITGFISQYPNGVENEPYRGFRDDAINTLGRCIMDSYCWQGSDIVIGRILHRSNNNPKRVWCWWNASGDFSASLFFCLKYLSVSSISAWLRSVLRLESPHWRAQLIVWLVGAYGIIHSKITWPSEFNINDRPDVSWAWSHCLRRDLGYPAGAGMPLLSSTLLPDDNRIEALRVLGEELTEDRLIEWLTSIAAFPYLVSELAEIPATFEHLYLRTTGT